MSIAEIKKSARGAASKRRAEAHAALKDEAGLALAARGLPDGLANRRGIVSGFIPYKSEITTLPLMAALLRATAGSTCAARRHRARGSRWSSAPGRRATGSSPASGIFRCRSTTAPEVLPDLLLVPDA